MGDIGDMDFDDLFVGRSSRAASRTSRRESFCSATSEEDDGPLVLNPRAASFRPGGFSACTGTVTLQPAQPVAEKSQGAAAAAKEDTSLVNPNSTEDRDSNKSDAETFIDEERNAGDEARAAAAEDEKPVESQEAEAEQEYSRPHSVAGFYDCETNVVEEIIRRQSYPSGSSLTHASRKEREILKCRTWGRPLPVDPVIEEPTSQEEDQATPTSPTTPGSPKVPGPRPRLEDFERLRMIGEGGFGKVFLVRKTSTGEYFALKSMRKDFVIRSNLVGTKTERSIMEKMRHPFIVTLHYAFQNEGRLFLVMDYVSGGQILTHLEKQSIFSEDATRFYCAEIALALKELHSRNIIHRDLKPENILLNAAGHIVVTDFGCSKETCDGGRADSFVGTDMYMAPEQITARDKGMSYGKVVDWWALGCLAWEMMVGRNPFEAKTKPLTIRKVMSLKLAMPKFLRSDTHSFLKLCLTRDPEKRLGANGADEVLGHRFFAAIDMEELLAGKIAPPLRPCTDTAASCDTSNVKDHYLKAPICESPIDASPLTTDQQLLFRGFTYERDSPFRSMVEAEALEEVLRIQAEEAEKKKGGVMIIGMDSAFGTVSGDNGDGDDGDSEDDNRDDIAESAWLEDQALGRVERLSNTRPQRIKPAQFEYPLDAASMAKAFCSAGPSVTPEDGEEKAKVVKQEKKIKMDKSSKQHGQKSNKKKR